MNLRVIIITDYRIRTDRNNCTDNWIQAVTRKKAKQHHGVYSFLFRIIYLLEHEEFTKSKGYVTGIAGSKTGISDLFCD